MKITNSIIHSLMLCIIRLRNKLTVCISFLFVCTFIHAQQDVMYSQYMNNMLNINPAYAGNKTTNNITALYRKQWVNVDGAPTTGNISWDYRKENSNVGYGVQLYNDKLGIETSTGFNAFYSYHIPLEKSSFIFGLSGGIMNYRAAYLTGTNPTQGGGVDPSFQGDINTILPIAGIGLIYTTDKWYLGLSAPALLRTKIYNNNYKVVSTINNRYFLTGGYVFDMSSIFKLKPSIMFKVNNGTSLHYDINLNGWFSNGVGFGVSYRSNDAVVGMAEFKIISGLTIGYAYDYLTSNLKTYSSGTHELMLRFEFDSWTNMDGLHRRLQSPRYY
jgi:type IX secretion system PorP/SprF family membrane protein